MPAYGILVPLLSVGCKAGANSRSDGCRSGEQGGRSRAVGVGNTLDERQKLHSRWESSSGGLYELKKNAFTTGSTRIHQCRP